MAKLPPSGVSGTSWPDAESFITRKRKRPGRRHRRAGKLAAKQAALDVQRAENLASFIVRASIDPDLAFPTMMAHQGYRRIDPFQHKTCPGCGAVFTPDFPPIAFKRNDPDFGHLAGRCIRCVRAATSRAPGAY